ncbi:tetratricopeptide repeat protein [Parasphingopyxis sp.]|uniref:tetratricopeptide repeat protein n=1 Tax=Parasphingopyxis sp. TaxID=1920299 RepID=UPI00261AEA1C|nr:tetratricopeptide repeat protein [Parasphingopyxis sp.]
MREVDEEVRKEQAVFFWERWGKWIAGLVIIGLAAFGGWLYWSNQQTAAAEAETEQLAQLLEDLNEGTPDDVDETLAALAESRRPIIRAEAMLTQAALALQNGDEETAVERFGAIAADDGLPQQFRDLALIRQTAIEFEDMEPQAVIDRMAGLAQPGNPWFGSAGELTAVAMMRQGNNDQAGAMFAQIANDEMVPQTLRTRAVQMAGVLGVDAVPDEPVEMVEEQAVTDPLAAPVAAEEATP